MTTSGDEESARSHEPGDGDQRDGTLSHDDVGRVGDRLRDARPEHPPLLSRAQPRQYCLAASDRIVSFNLLRTAVVTPCMVCYRHGA